MRTLAQFDRLALFSFAWAVATLMHLLSFPERLVLGNIFTWLTGVFAALVLFNPASIRLLMLMLACSIIKSFQWMPFTPNHILFEWILNIGMLIACVLMVKNKNPAAGDVYNGHSYREEIFNSFAPFARISLFILYFFAVLHKLNWDYFNPDISCGPFLLQGYGGRLPGSWADNSAIRESAVWGTLIIEAAIPLFLLFSRTRTMGIALGLGFHYFLAIHPHPGLYSFSSMLFALYCLFVSPQFPQKLEAAAATVFGKNWNHIVVVSRKALAGFILLLLAVVVSRVLPNYVVNKIGLLIWLAWGLVCMVVFSWITIKYKTAQEGFRSSYHFGAPAFWVVPTIIFLNGLSPYLGLKTQTSFSMFSNLRTEGGVTNHLFIPVTFQMTDREKDLVEVVNTNHNDLKEFIAHNQLLTFFELRRLASTAGQDFYVDYKRNGMPQHLEVANGKSSDQTVTEPINYLAYKFIRFRPIDKGPCTCKH